MLALAHAACMAQPMPTGGSYAEHLRVLARARDPLKAAQAAEELQAPEYPEPFQYLRDWSDALYGRSGVAMDGLAPLSWVTLDAWARRSCVDVTPSEADALLRLDSIRRHPPTMAELLPQLREAREVA